MILHLMLLIYPLIVFLQMILLPLAQVMLNPYKMLTRILMLVLLTLQMSSRTQTSLYPKRFSDREQEMAKFSTSSDGETTLFQTRLGNRLTIFWINAFWMNSKESLRFNLFLVLLLLLPPQLVHTQERSTFNYDLNSQRVTYYPESLMLPRNPRAIVFYQDTNLLNMFVDLCTPEIGHDFPINNTCYSDKSHFLSQLLEQLRTAQKSIQLIMFSHHHDSFIKWYYSLCHPRKLSPK